MAYTSAPLNDYSELKCPPHLWAKPKLLTFAKQSASFLHVDGDVFIWRKFNDTLMSSGLIAQNLEIGTQYYKNAFLPLLNELTNIPRGLKKNLISLNMRAYNAGIIGGHDIDFFKRYVSTAIRFVEKNSKVESNFNILFEQLLFYTMT